MRHHWKLTLGFAAIGFIFLLTTPVVNAQEKQSPKVRKAVSTMNVKPQKAVFQKPEPILGREETKRVAAGSDDPLSEDCGCTAKWRGVINGTRYGER